MMNFKNYAVAISLVSAGLLTACEENGNKGGEENTDVNNPQIEALATTPKWNNYLVAATDELYKDCVKLWAAWAGPSALNVEELALVGGTDFWMGSELNAPDGYAALLKDANNGRYGSGLNAIEQTIIQGTIDIAGEVGGQKIGGPYGHALAGNYVAGVLEVESWYSWNSITDYSDNIISVRNSYLGSRDNTANVNSLSAFVKANDADLDTQLKAAIHAAYTGIKSMDAPFRNNLTGTKVVAAMKACADLEDIYTQKLLSLVSEKGKTVDFTPILTAYADEIVVKSYADMKDKAKKLKDAARAYADSPSNSKLSAVCDAWKATRIPWEQSEAFLYGPADLLNLDPSLDSWPLDQDDILTILKDAKLTSVEQIQGAITGEGVRGFHTIELLLFKDGKDRTIDN